MNYDLTLTDATGTETFTEAEIPITTTPVEIGTDVQVLSGAVYTDFISSMKTWTRTFTYLEKDTFDTLKGFYDRQFTLFTYPLLTITDEGVVNVPVRMTLSGTNIIDSCGTISEVTVSFRQARS